MWYQREWGKLRIVSRVGDTNFRKWFKMRFSLLSQLAPSRSPGTRWSSVGSLLLSDHGGLSKTSSTQLPSPGNAAETFQSLTKWNTFRRVLQHSPSSGGKEQVLSCSSDWEKTAAWKTVKGGEVGPQQPRGRACVWPQAGELLSHSQAQRQFLSPYWCSQACGGRGETKRDFRKAFLNATQCRNS